MDAIDDLFRRTMDRLSQRRLPESTYRLQFHAGFTFRDATAILPYLRDLGVTHVYASPYLKATPGSTHGYDVIDHGSLNPELGTTADYEAFVRGLEENDLEHILDIVPNHVGVATNDNVWWNDVLANGRQSRYASFFDINWESAARPEMRGKVLLPLLGAPYGEVLEKGELVLKYDAGVPWVYYYERRFPISPETRSMVFDGNGKTLSEAERLKRVEQFHGRPGEPRSFDRLDALLARQHYRLAYWKLAAEEINYRRFFDINDLAALAMEREEVFEATHALVLRLYGEGKLAGFRVDHPDGLYDPEQYFRRLQRHAVLATAKAAFDAEPSAVGETWEAIRPRLLDRIARAGIGDGSEPAQRPVYVVAEKILATGESLPGTWAVHGTSGYDFLNAVNDLFIDPAAERPLTELYHEWAANVPGFEELAYEKKKLILRTALPGDLRALTHRLDRLAQEDRRSRDFTFASLHHALAEVIACFPVYRSYVSDRGVGPTDREHVAAAVAEARRRNAGMDGSALEFVRDAILQEAPRSDDEQILAERLRFAGKFQQLTAPTTAKGVEDTAFYVYNRFVSLNEVGGDPARFAAPAEDLHRYLQDRRARWASSLSALSTHDAKRSEDVRARLNVLSEMPGEWRDRVGHWRDINAPHRTSFGGGRAAPDANDEYLLYQTLVGAWPLEPYSAEEFAAFAARVGQYMTKAMREAKVHTRWTSPDATYEAAVHRFVTAVLDPHAGRAFIEDCIPFVRRVAEAGLTNSLAQTVLRLTAPGAPDTYQGTELWDFSLVDPDNRRPVDYGRRREAVAELSAGMKAGTTADFVRGLVETIRDGRIKLHVTREALRCRRAHPGLFSTGEYIAAGATGPAAANLFGFARRAGDAWAVVAVPRSSVVRRGGREQTSLDVPRSHVPGRWRNVLTGETIGCTASATGTSFAAADLFATAPVALLVARSST